MKKIYLSITVFLSLTEFAGAQTWSQVLDAQYSTAGAKKPVAISGDYAAIGLPAYDFNQAGEATENFGCVLIYQRSPENIWELNQELFASDGEIHDSFGSSVAMEDDRLIIGSKNNGSPDVWAGAAQGAAYIFEKNAAGEWLEMAKIMAPYPEEGAQFSLEVDIYGDYAVVGTPQQKYDDNHENPLDVAGAAYVFERTPDNAWNYMATLLPPQREAWDQFAESVSIYENHILIGMPGESEDSEGLDSLLHSGAAFLYERNLAGEWELIQKLVSQDRAEGDLFGTSVSIYNEQIVIGAPYEDEDQLEVNTVYNSGSAYVFRYDATEGNWLQFQKILPSFREEFMHFGAAVVIEEDMLLVGAPWNEVGPDGGYVGPRVGVAFRFSSGTEGMWSEMQTMFPSQHDFFQQFGYSVTLSGNTALIGSSLFGANFWEPCPSSATMHDTHCFGPYISPSGNYVWEEPGTYHDTIPAAPGCPQDIAATFTFTNFLDMSVSVNADTLTSNFGTGAQFLWLRCTENGYFPAPGNNEFQYYKGQPGQSYAVVVTASYNHCTDTSECYAISPVGIEEYENNRISVFPNPTGGNVNVYLGAVYKQVTIIIQDLGGKTVFYKNYNSLQKVNIDLDNATGIYLMEIREGNKVLGRKKLVLVDY